MANPLEKFKSDLTIENVLSTAMRTPGVKIDREKFLNNELRKYCSESVIKHAVKSNPAKAGIETELINKISQDVINYETTKVTAISVAASLPSGPTAVAAAAADITSYFAFIMRTIQKLAYIYGFEQFEFNDDDADSETMNSIVLFMGVMFGVQGTSTMLGKVANKLAERVAKQLAREPLTKGIVYPIVKKVITSLGMRMTKQIFADTVASAIPVASGALSGALTYAMFKPGCMKLRKQLMTYNLCKPEFYRSFDKE